MPPEVGMVKKISHVPDPESVDAYIAGSPENARRKLAEIRKAILEVAPGSIESTGYFDMPGYSYEGYDYNGMFAWFGIKKSHIGLYLRPPAIQRFEKELSGFETTKAVVHFPLDGKIPITLVKKLVKESMNIMKDRRK